MMISVKLIKLVKDFTKDLVDKIYSLIPIQLLVIESHRGIFASSNKKVCLFAAWDPEGIVDKYVLNYLDEIIKNGFDVYFCSTSPVNFNSESLLELKSRCRYIYRRINLGLDFASWKLCYLKLPFDHSYEQLLLTNDSVFGPIFSLSETFNQIDLMKEDVIGMTDNFERAHHLQSYFLLFRGEVITTFLGSFFKSVKILRNKDMIIEKYEVGLSKELIRRGKSLGAVYPVNNTIQKVKDMQLIPNHGELKPGLAVNSTTVFWNTLIEHFRFPFVKREVLTKSVAPSISTKNWHGFLSQYNIDLGEVVQNYLIRTKR